MPLPRLAWLIAAALFIYLLSPILTPFIAAAILAYLGDPLVDKLEKRMPRMWAVVCVFLSLLVMLTLIIIVLIPFISGQISHFITELPNYISVAKGLISEKFPNLISSSSANSFNETIKEHIGDLSNVVSNFLNSISSSANAVLTWVSYIVLIPVVTFYLLRDWDKLVAKIGTFIPIAHKETVTELAKRSDDVLGAFLRGQLMVMTGLGILYAIGLKIVGIDLAITIGFFAGFISFVPYLGLIVGIILAAGMAIVQFHDWMHLLGVFLAFGVAQTIESVVLTPKFVGDSIGIHPVMVLFSVLAGGQIFGFMGILLALPVAAIINVIFIYYMPSYFKSDFYRKMPDNLE